MDTVLFFQKGKFFGTFAQTDSIPQLLKCMTELYETDADLGHQLFDLKVINFSQTFEITYLL